MASKKKEPYVPIPSLIGEGTDYNVYTPSAKEKILWFLIGLAVGGVVLFVFYSNLIVSVVAGLLVGYFFIPIRTKQVIKKRKTKLSSQFKGMLETLSTSIGAGKNIYDAFSSAVDDLAVQFNEDADIVEEAKIIRLGLDNNIRIEELLLNFAARSGLDDVKNFANVFATCYQKGGNIKEVVKNTATIISDKIAIQMEIETMVAGQKNEQNIMLVMPMLFVVMMRSMGGDLVDLSSPVGILSVTAAIAIFALAYFISQKILNIKL